MTQLTSCSSLTSSDPRVNVGQPTQRSFEQAPDPERAQTTLRDLVALVEAVSWGQVRFSFLLSLDQSDLNTLQKTRGKPVDKNPEELVSKQL